MRPFTDSISANAKALDHAAKNPRKQVCINDDLDYDSENIGENLRMISNFYETNFPEKSSFEI